MIWRSFKAWSPDGTRLASGGGGRGELFVWEARSGERLHTLSWPNAAVQALAWSPGGTQLLSGSSDGMLRWCALKRGECVRVRKAHRGTIQSLKRNPDGLLLASYGMTALSTSGIWRAATTCARCCEIGPKSGSISAG